MKKLLTTSCFLVSLLLGANSALADIPYSTERHHSPVPQIVFECGDMETAISNLVAQFFVPASRQPDVIDHLTTAMSASLFFANLQACECRARLEGHVNSEVLSRCFAESAVLAKLLVKGVGQSLTNTTLSEMDSDELEALFGTRSY